MIVDTTSPEIATRNRNLTDKVHEKMRETGYGWIMDYEAQLFRANIPCIFHGTHLSNATGIGHDGLVPILEKNLTQGYTYLVANPISAAYHVITGGQFDTYESDADFPKLDPMTRIKNDPFILLKIDIEVLKKYPYSYRDPYKRALDKWKEFTTLFSQGYVSLDHMGIGFEYTIMNEYIRAIIHDKQGKIHELSLDDLMNKVLLRNELGIYPDFLD